MLLDDNTGIRCDRCWVAHQSDFTYYSFDFQVIHVTRNVLPAFQYNKQPIFSMDICQSCMDDISDIVKKKYKPTKMHPQRQCPKGINCDLTGTHLTGEYDFYLCVIAKVVVQLSGKALICKGCGQQVTDSDKPCPKCNHNEIHQRADTMVTDRFVELWLCESAYKTLQQRAIELRTNPEANKWSMNT